MSISDILKRSKDEGLFTHAYAALGKLDDPTVCCENAILPNSESIFDLASLTKAVVTTPLVFSLLETGELPALTSTLGSWLGPKAQDLHPALRELTVAALLRHESGLPAWRNFWVCHLGPGHETNLRLADVHQRLVLGLNRVATEIRIEHPKYSDLGFLLLGLALERQRGCSLADQFDGFCRDTLGLACAEGPLGFPVNLSASLPNWQKHAVPTAFCAVRSRHLQGEVHDENCASLGGVTGHAGLFGTGQALGRFLKQLSKSKIGRLLLEQNAAARRLPVGETPNESLLGWRQAGDPSSRPFGDGEAMGHLGFTGVAFWVWPEKQHYAILLTNRVIGGRSRPGIAQLRRDIFTEFARLLLK